MTAKPLRPFRDIRVAAMSGVLALGLGLGSVGVWSTTAPLAGAVIAGGQVVVESNLRRIQHPTGGVVAEIFVEDGDIVKAGEVLVRLDATTARANLAIIEIQYFQMLARKARLEAERDDLAEVTLPQELQERGGDPAVQSIVAGELSVFRSRREARQGQMSQLRERISQTREEIGGLEAQADAAARQIELIEEELKGIRQLFDQDLLPMSRLTALERDAAELLGTKGQFVAETARARGRISETELQILQVDQDFKSEVSAELRDVEGKIADLQERRIAAIDQMDRIDIRSPQDGVVHQSMVHTVGGVVSAGEQIMMIVPQEDGLVVDAMIDPRMIDRIALGQEVRLRFPAFDTTTTPDLVGTVVRIAADITHNSDTGQSYYLVRVGLSEPERRKLAGKPLVPGMPVETYIQTGERTALAYLLKPLRDQLERTFRYD